MSIDLHCHLDLYANAGQLADEVQRRGTAVLSVTTTPSAFRGTSAIAANHPTIKTALGLHPEVAAQREHELDLFDRLLHQTQFVGEVGLDGSPRFSATRDAQLRVFEHILRSCADAGGRLLSIHSRGAAALTLHALARVSGVGVPVLHWFTGTLKEVEQAIAAGCWFSIGQPMLQSAKGRELARHLGGYRVLTETDGPLVAAGGGPAYPWHVQRAVEMLAEIWQQSMTETTSRLQANLAELVSAAGVPPLAG